jgi:feruloyl-CoA synthase
VASRNSAGLEGVTFFREIAEKSTRHVGEEAAAAISADTAAKFLFTSGSTGLPKGVTTRTAC